MSLDPFFNPRSVALIGAAHTEQKLGGIVLKNLLRFRGKVYPVNPKYGELMGLKAYRTFAELPEPVDLSIIMRPAAEIPEVLTEQKDRVKCTIIVSSGFAESGDTGLQDGIKRIGKEWGVRIIGPNCIGIFNPRRSLDTLFLSHQRLKRPKRGNVALLSQSGAVISSLLETVRESNTGVSKSVGYGNAVDVDESELYDYFAGDKDTDVVVSYIESVGDGRRFVEAAKRLSAEKSLILLKAGKGTSGQAAAFSHTGRLAGRYEVFTSIVKRFGIHEAMDFDELMDATKALSFQRPEKGTRVCIITNGGGAGVLAADECMKRGLEVPRISTSKIDTLKGHFPYFFSLNNPIDLTVQAKDDDYRTVLDLLKDEYDGFLVIAMTAASTITEKLGELIKDFRRHSDKAIVFHIPYARPARRLIKLLEKSKTPVYPSPERAVKGLKAILY